MAKDKVKKNDKMPEPMNTADMIGIAEATRSAPDGFAFAHPVRAGELANAGLVMVNDAIKDANGNIAVRATEAGLALAGNAEQKGTNTVEASQNAPAKRVFEIDTDVPMPVGRSGSGGGRESVYPLEKLELGHSFHIPVTAEVPEPWKKYMSVASTGAKRFAEKVVNPDGSAKMVTKTNKKGETVTVQERTATRKFSIKRVGDEDKRGPGARIYRTA